MHVCMSMCFVCVYGWMSNLCVCVCVFSTYDVFWHNFSQKEQLGCTHSPLLQKKVSNCHGGLSLRLCVSVSVSVSVSVCGSVS